MNGIHTQINGTAILVIEKSRPYMESMLCQMISMIGEYPRGKIKNNPIRSDAVAENVMNVETIEDMMVAQVVMEMNRECQLNISLPLGGDKCRAYSPRKPFDGMAPSWVLHDCIVFETLRYTDYVAEIAEITAKYDTMAVYVGKQKCDRADEPHVNIYGFGYGQINHTLQNCYDYHDLYWRYADERYRYCLIEPTFYGKKLLIPSSTYYDGATF